MVARYHLAAAGASSVAGTIVDALDQVAREGARLMLQRALEAEVDEFLGRGGIIAGPSFAAIAMGCAAP